MVLEWLCDLFHSAAKLCCRAIRVGTCSSHCIAEAGKWDASGEVKNWAISASTLLAVCNPMIVPNCLPVSSILTCNTIFTYDCFPCIYKARVNIFFLLYRSLFSVWSLGPSSFSLRGIKTSDSSRFTTCSMGHNLFSPFLQNNFDTSGLTVQQGDKKFLCMVD